MPVIYRRGRLRLRASYGWGLWFLLAVLRAGSRIGGGGRKRGSW